MVGTSCLRLSGIARMAGEMLAIDVPPTYPDRETETVWLRTRIAPLDVLEDGRLMARAAGVRLRLAVVDDLGGVAGLYVPGLVVLGLADCARIADQIWSTRVRAPTALDRVLTPSRLITRPHLVRAVRRRILAHELGHAMVAQGCDWTPCEDEELSADYLAGRISAALAWSLDLGQVIFEVVGCSGHGCTHPEPAFRAHAYATGYSEQLMSQHIAA